MDKKLGEAMLGYMTLEKYQMKDARSESGWGITKVFKSEFDETDRKPRILAGYCGGTPDNEYSVDGDKKHASLFPTCQPVIDEGYSARMQGVKDDKAKYFVTNGGSSRPRPIQLKNENGLWRLYNVTGLMTGIALTTTERAKVEEDRAVKKKAKEEAKAKRDAERNK
jgi:hypothetical protein